MRIIGITGTNAAGKSTAVDYLVRKCGFKSLSLSDEVREELKKRGLSETRENLIAVANSMRSLEGDSVLARRLIRRLKNEGFLDDRGDVPGIVIDSVRNTMEISELKKLGIFSLWSIDAPVKERWKRAVKRGRAEAGSLSEFQELENREFEKRPGRQQLGLCISMADEAIHNDGTVKQLYERIDSLLS